MNRGNPDKSMVETLEALLDRLQLVQRALGEGYQGEIALRSDKSLQRSWSSGCSHAERALREQVGPRAVFLARWAQFRPLWHSTKVRQLKISFTGPWYFFQGDRPGPFAHLRFGDLCPWEAIEKVTATLRDTFVNEGCLRLEPKNHIPAIIG
ncbi:hypothetical protein F5883DRAFT_592788 [Diaporthe sp. PMI_573]|jgi:hypothetical protein|nr:hypothetical protein F5883DRAFT_592788 [Diaporthaceae sp. PMI_573]